MQFDEVLQSFLEFFDREGIRHAVIGGLAMQAWGHARFTKDIDMVVARSNQPRVLEFARSLGYETLYVSTGYSNHLHSDRAFGRIDFMYPDDDTARKLFDSASFRPVIGALSAPVASPEHLAMMKGLAMKQNPARALFEGEDVRQLLSLPGIDRQVVRDYFARIGMLEMLDVIEKAR
ncbi:MAG: hypothetical protein ABI837_13845 [Acidobacteriota bacterium]